MFRKIKKMDLCLPPGYEVQHGPTQYIDLPGEFIYQPHVYALAGFLGMRSEAKWIIDIGCGSGRKLIPFAEKFEIIGIDSGHGIELATRCIPKAQLIEFDLEKGFPPISEHVLKQAIIICSDVVEHLHHPERLLMALVSVADISPYVLISTPDRDRARGWLDDGPPKNPAHVMEWAGTEFVRFMRRCGFKDIQFYGHTINTDFHRVKSTLLVVTGVETICDIRKEDFSVAAVMHTYNEVDSLPEVIEHLQFQGIEVHVFDNWSTDGTWELLSELQKLGNIVNVERFPSEPQTQYQWCEQLKKTTEYAQSLNAKWIIHQDADEIRLPPWNSVTLRDAFRRIDELGYNAVDFTVLDFRYLASCPMTRPPYQESLTHFEFGRRPGHFSQIKAWKNVQHVELASTGGHEAKFEGRRIYPLKFLLKHYPLRNKVQAKNKVFLDRLPRFATEKELFGWHVQYDQYSQTDEIPGWNPQSLEAWHTVYFMSEFLVERLSGIGLLD